MKKRSSKLLILSIVIIVVLYSFVTLTGILRMYTIPTTSNEPTIPVNSRVASSNLVDYEKGDFICFYKKSGQDSTKAIWLFRLVGLAGDIIEMENGVLYVNGEHFDKDLDLLHDYVVEHKVIDELVDKGVIDKFSSYHRFGDQMIVSLRKEVAKEYGVESHIQTEPEYKVDKHIKKVYSKDWNRDYFGPLTIPEGKCFVIGDNRHNALDSRFSGLIDISDIVGTLIYK